MFRVRILAYSDIIFTPDTNNMTRSVFISVLPSSVVLCICFEALGLIGRGKSLHQWLPTGCQLTRWSRSAARGSWDVGQTVAFGDSDRSLWTEQEVDVVYVVTSRQINTTRLTPNIDFSLMNTAYLSSPTHRWRSCFRGMAGSYPNFAHVISILALHAPDDKKLLRKRLRHRSSMCLSRLHSWRHTKQKKVITVYTAVTDCQSIRLNLVWQKVSAIFYSPSYLFIISLFYFISLIVSCNN